MRSYWTNAEFFIQQVKNVPLYTAQTTCTDVRKYAFSGHPLLLQCHCCNTSVVQNLVWWKLHIVRLRIPPTEGDLRDLLWHSICAPKREIQIHLARRSAGTVWGNPISRTGTPHPQSHLFTSQLCQQNGRPSLSIRSPATACMDRAQRQLCSSFVYVLCYYIPCDFCRN